MNKLFNIWLVFVLLFPGEEKLNIPHGWHFYYLRRLANNNQSGVNQLEWPISILYWKCFFRSLLLFVYSQLTSTRTDKHLLSKNKIWIISNLILDGWETGVCAEQHFSTEAKQRIWRREKIWDYHLSATCLLNTKAREQNTIRVVFGFGSAIICQTSPFGFELHSQYLICLVFPSNFELCHVGRI